MARVSKNYVNNRSFYEALVKRKELLKQAEQNGTEPPEIDRYICECILHICKKLSFSPKFINYSFKEEMIGEAIYACIANVDKFETNVISIKQTLTAEETEGLKGKTLIGETSGAKVMIKSYNKETKRVIASLLDEEKLEQKENVWYINNSGEKVTFKLEGITYSNPFAYFTQCAWNAYVGRIKQEKHETKIKAAIFQSVSTEFLDIQDHDHDENFSNGYIDFMKNNAYMDMDLTEPPKKAKKKKEIISVQDVPDPYNSLEIGKLD